MTALERLAAARGPIWRKEAARGASPSEIYSWARACTASARSARNLLMLCAIPGEPGSGAIALAAMV